MELSTLIDKASFKYKASEKISAEDIMDNVVELLKGKVYLANEVYGLLRDICEKNRANQVQAYGESIYYIVQFQYLQSCNVFFSYLLEECQENAWKLKENFHVGRIKDALPSEEKLVVDVVVRDPGSFLTEHFDEIRRELLREKDLMPNVHDCHIESQVAQPDNLLRSAPDPLKERQAEAASAKLPLGYLQGGGQAEPSEPRSHLQDGPAGGGDQGPALQAVRHVTLASPARTTSSRSSSARSPCPTPSSKRISR